MSNYELNVISRHKDFNNKILKKFYLDGIDTVGVYENEEFSIEFKNNTNQKICLILSLDGTNILTGKPADTEASSKMWMVNAYDTLSLKAWPENDGGGAAFVFTSANNSVAVHTHGDLSSRGIIAAAVFIEGHVEPTRLVPNYHYNNNYYSSSFGGRRSSSSDILRSKTIITSSLGNTTKGISSNSIEYSADVRGFDMNVDSFRSDISEGAAAASSESNVSKSLESLVSVGAGQHVNQQITYVKGLIKPMFNQTVRIKYLWWDDLVSKLRTESNSVEQPSGFPGDKNKKNIDLKRTPRLPRVGKDKQVFRFSPEIDFSRF